VNAPAPSAVSTRVLKAVFALALTAPLWGIGQPLIEVDDARYAEVPRELAASGDWTTPRLNGFAYVEKPPLGYWLGAASYKVFGVSEAAGRAPLAALAAASLAGVAWLGNWLFAPALGMLAAVILGSCALFFFLTHYITPDLGLTTWLLWCSAMILRALLRPDDARWAGPAAWLFAALAFLSKGLVALVFPGVWTAAMLALHAGLRTRKGVLGLVHPAGPLLFCALVGPWLWLMEASRPGFFHFFFVEQHFQRFLTEKYNRVSPWYFFLLVAPAGLLPWTAYALSGLQRAVRETFAEPRDSALALWVLLITAFFSTSQSKLATYILPVFPHLALLAARELQRPAPMWARNVNFVFGGLFLAAGTGAVLAVAGGFSAVTKLAGGLDATYALGALALLTLGEALFVAGLNDRRAFTNLALAGLLLGGVSLVALRQRTELVSAKELCARVGERLEPGDRLYAYGTFIHGVPFYFKRPYDMILNWVGELHYAKRDPSSRDRFGDDNDVRALATAPLRAALFMRAFETEHVLKLLPPERVHAVIKTGPWAAIVAGEATRRSAPADPR
jgi:4-amino-4-deoxy-L-arabinose transferase-like glycosyltransferase